MNNASKNLAEMFDAAYVQGKVVQYQVFSAGWSDLELMGIESNYMLSPDGLSRKWRLKPESVEEAWDYYRKKCVSVHDMNYKAFKAGYEAGKNE